MSLQMYWFKRYINYKNDDYWTVTLYQIFNVSLHNRMTILTQGIEFYNQNAIHCKYSIIRNIIQILQEFLWEFVTIPEEGVNRLIL